MLALMLLVMSSLNGPERADADDADATPATRHVAAGPQYRAGAVHRFLFGSGYRNLWTTSIPVEVLDLERFSGGLTARKKGGGKETKTLTLAGRDGRKWKFRSIDKDPTEALPEALQGTYVDTLAQDQISASLPANVLVVGRLAEAAGIPHVDHRVVVLPDSPRLGEFRGFARMLGTLEEDVSIKPPVTPGFEGYDRLIDTDELEGVLDSDLRERVDARAYLKARLFDMLIGDYDRHGDQWDWARSVRTGLWEPVPKDRDLAFVKFDGLMLDLARTRVPHLVDFEGSYPNIVGLTWQSRFLDRRYLAELEWPVWNEVTSELQGRLTDEVIDEAVARLPSQYYRVDGASLAATLKLRRQRLPDAAHRFYKLLAREAEVHGTDQAEALRIEREREGAVTIALEGAGRTLFQRRYDPSETREVRVFLNGGDDRVRSDGRGSSRIKVRVVGGDGNDLLDDSAGGETRFYDSGGQNEVLRGPGTRASSRPYTPPVDERGNPERDWGAETFFWPWIRVAEDYGFTLGAGLQRRQYGFRKHPYAARHSLRAEYATALHAGAVSYDYRSLRTDYRTRFLVTAKVSALALIRFYGFGNETSSFQDLAFFEVDQTQYSLAPSYRLGFAAVDVLVGPVVKYVDTRLPPTTLVGLLQPYGTNGGFGQVGGRLGIVFDRRNRETVPSKGVIVSGEGSFYPAAWSVAESFGEVHGLTSAYFTMPLPLEPILALRVGGAKTWGRYPLHEAATIGGGDTVRGLRRERYTGDAALHGGSELRLRLLHTGGSLPIDGGIMGLADAGRVFVQGESSNRWHTGVGGGLWFSFVEPQNTVSFAVARSEDRVQFLLQAGFIF